MGINKHITPDEMMNFINLSPSDLRDSNFFSESLDIIAHILECDECKKMKNDMEMFMGRLGKALGGSDLYAVNEDDFEYIPENGELFPEDNEGFLQNM